MLQKLAAGLSWATALPLALGFRSPLPAVYGPRFFDLTVTWEQHAPNGVSRDMILINGQFPGPLLEINEGDEVWVTVNNLMPFNTTMHYHGIEMLHTPWSDGVPGVSQREIPPGETFVYKWTATQYGEYWYHAHQRGQLEDGQFGPIIIHPKPGTPTPFSLISKDHQDVHAMEEAAAHVQPLILSDWRNIPADKAWNIEVEANMEIPCYDSLLINGQGNVDCWSASKIASLTSPQMMHDLQIGGAKSLTAKACLPKTVDAILLSDGKPTNLSAIPPGVFDVCTPSEGSHFVVDLESGCDGRGKWAAFDVVGAYGTFTTAFSIDELPLWIYAVDGEYIEPQLVDAISVTNGDRYSFLVHLTEPGQYTIRHASTLPVQLLTGEATLSYRLEGQPPSNRTSMPYINDAGVPVSTNVTFFNQTLQKPFPPYPVGQKADQTFIVHMSNTDAGYKWAINGTSDPLTLDAAGEPILFQPHPYETNNLTITTLNNTWIDLIFVATQYPQPAHPIHKHNNKMWLIGSGQGPFNWTSVDAAMKEIPQNFNLVDPPRRDGFATLGTLSHQAWTAIRYHVDNPGAWFLHCHIQTHLIGGMSMVIQDGIDHWPVVPPEYLNFGQ